MRLGVGLRCAAGLAVVLTLIACGDDDDGSSASATTTSTATASTTTASTAALSARAAELTDLMAANDWVAVREDFDEAMLGAVSEAKLHDVWTSVTAQFGQYKARGEPVEVPKDSLHVVFDTRMTFERGDMKSRVAFNVDGSIGGLFILVPDAP